MNRDMFTAELRADVLEALDRVESLYRTRNERLERSSLDAGQRFMVKAMLDDAYHALVRARGEFDA